MLSSLSLKLTWSSLRWPRSPWPRRCRRGLNEMVEVLAVAVAVAAVAAAVVVVAENHQSSPGTYVLL
jgi:hypothetical protein